MTAYRFDSPGRRIVPFDPEGPVEVLCLHLAPALAYLLDQGSTIVGVARMAWSKIDLEVSLDRGPAPEGIPEHLHAGTGMCVWVNADPHYPQARGLLCERCRQSLGWPLERGTSSE